ncbi:hypothetical protein Q5P01_004409 [Channa striata]|uniref:Ig-like domain-containing protein n=1 Tax=Channa striata TaxID=64152 RepID=A0AA88NHN2_CHASR|nr:hypothetical protein Q5P01_004409 [Channa striata]
MDLLGMLLSVLLVSGASADCSKTPELIITAPKKMEALSGSCLMIPCNFRHKPEKTFNSRGSIYGVWIKNESTFKNPPNNVIFNSSRTINKYPMNITGNLRQTNCTTEFSNLTLTHTDTYYFRIETEGFKATAICDLVQISVKDSAPRPVLQIPGDVKEKDSVTITCSALTPCPHSPPKLTWTLQQEPHTNIERNTDGTFTAKIQETVTLSDTHDGLNISCWATYPVNGGRDVRDGRDTRDAQNAPKDTSASISPSAWVSAGTWVNLSCSSRARPPVSSFTWFESSQHGATTVSEGAVYSLNATQGGVYYCVAANALGNQTSPRIQLLVGGKGESLLGAAVIGGISGAVLLTCVTITIWWLKSKHSSSHQPQSLTDEDTVYQETTRTTEEETLLYENLNFSTWRDEVSSDSVQDSEQQQDMHAQVKMSKTGNSLTADGPEDLYSQVKKKLF